MSSLPASPLSSFPNSVWECHCLRNSVSREGQRSCGDNYVPKQSLGTRRRIWGALLIVFLTASVSAFGADDTSQENRFISNPRQLVFEGKRSGEGYFSPDGKKLIFQSEREPGNPFFQQYILNLESGETTRVSPGKGKTTCGFFQPGTDRVLFSSTHADPQTEAKQKAELEFRASGKQRRYSWDYDDTADIFSA